MAKLVPLSVFALLVLTPAAPARAETWCLRNFGATGGTCVFPTARACIAAARVGGGVCEREPAGFMRPESRQLRRGAAQR